MPIPPFNAYLGTEIRQRDDGTIETRLELGPHHLNRRGVAHGGVITSLLDSALGAAVIAAIPKEWWCATTSLTTQFLGGAGTGLLTATGRVLRRARNVAFAAGEVRDAADRLVATAIGTWHLWPYRPVPDVSELPGHWVRMRGGGRPLQVGKILAVGRNYAEHVAEMGAPPDAPPVLFFKPPTAIPREGSRIRLPADGGEVHHEVELVVVIGRPGRRIPATRALEHVSGYGVGLDLTLREVQSEAKRRGEPWSLAKGFDGSAPVSRIVPRDEVGDGSGLAIRLTVNGELRQSGNTSQMLRPVAELIASASRWVTLDEGDLLFTGTPSGVGPVRPGDRVEAEIENVAKLVVEFDSDEGAAATGDL